MRRRGLFEVCFRPLTLKGQGISLFFSFGNITFFLLFFSSSLFPPFFFSSFILLVFLFCFCFLFFLCVFFCFFLFLPPPSFCWETVNDQIIWRITSFVWLYCHEDRDWFLLCEYSNLRCSITIHNMPWLFLDAKWASAMCKSKLVQLGKCCAKINAGIHITHIGTTGYTAESLLQHFY